MANADEVQKLIFKSGLPPGDIIMLTAAVRDLHRIYPERFMTDVRTSYPELWENNPYITPLNENDPTCRVIEFSYPLIDLCNDSPVHFLEGFLEYLRFELGVPLKPTSFGGDIHLSDTERISPGPIEQLVGTDVPYWIIVSGGKYDFSVKWWRHGRYQEVVDRFAGKILFVQTGQPGAFHPPLDGVIDLRGKTSLRELVRLVYFADGVLCPITMLMHLAAAVEDQPETSRACVTIAGGREPVTWPSYPQHQFLHTIGALRCCATGGCWKGRVSKLNEGHDSDDPSNFCESVTPDGQPQCMDMIHVNQVCEAISLYYSGDIRRFCNSSDLEVSRGHLSRTLADQLQVQTRSLTSVENAQSLTT